MKDLLKLIAGNLVDKPEEVKVTETIDEANKSVLLVLSVAPEDMGKVIGKQGRIAKAIRTVMKAAAIHENKHVTIEIS